MQCDMVVVTNQGGPGPLSVTPSPWNCLAWPWRRRLRVVWLTIVTALFCALPMLIVEMQKHAWAAHYQAWFLAGLFSLMTLPVAFYEVALHLEYFSRPPLQRHIVRIMFLPPIYALDSWFCLRFIEARTLLTPIRECYEAYTIYNFFMYLIRYLEAQVGSVPDYMANKGTTAPHILGMQYLSHPWVGKELYRECRKGVLNYVIVRPITAAIMWITLTADEERYQEGEFVWSNVWTYVTAVNNFSQCWALYVLMLFYVAMHDELRPLNPLRKFVTIKLVVFFSFWQGLLITLLATTGVLRAKSTWRTYSDTADLAGGLQDFLICIEMFFAAVGFAWAFPPRDYMVGEPPGFWRSVASLFDFADVVDDVQDRVNEEYREITTRPIQKIMAPIRNNPLFSKSRALVTGTKHTGGDSEMVPLTAATGDDAPPLPTSTVDATRMSTTAKEAFAASTGERTPARSGGLEGCSGSGAVTIELPQSSTGANTDSTAGMGASAKGTNANGSIRGPPRPPPKKLQSHVD